MSFEITVAFVNQYRSNVIHLAQQKGSKLRNSVRFRGDVVGKADHFERVGATVAVRKTSRHSDTPLISTPHSRRRVTLEPYEWADLVDKEDDIRVLIDPQAEYSKAGYMALGRAMDDVIITAVGGNSVAVDENDAGTNVALTNTIANGGTGFTPAKIRQAMRIMDNLDVEAEDRFIVASPFGKEDLLAETTVTSSDYVTVKALVDGQINTWLGFTFIWSTRLPKTGNIRSAYAYQKEGVGLCLGRDITTKMSERADKSYAMQVYASMDLGATRVEEARVVQIDYDESV